VGGGGGGGNFKGHEICDSSTSLIFFLPWLSFSRNVFETG